MNMHRSNPKNCGFQMIDLQKLLIVQQFGANEMARPVLAPPDLRRMYAQLGYEAGVPVTQISRLLGHASVATTQRYLNLDLDLKTTVSDFVPL
jgi:integrase